MKLNNRGVTLAELIVVIGIIAILAGLTAVSITNIGITASERAKSHAEDIRQYLNFARLRAIGSERPIIVTFDPAANSYYACFDTDNSNFCEGLPGEITDLNLPMPDRQVGGSIFNGVTLPIEARYEAGFGIGTLTPQADGHVAVNGLLGTLAKSAITNVYYQEPGAAIPGNGMALDLAGNPRIIFRRNGNAIDSTNATAGGSIYLFLRRQQDNDTAYQYAIDVNRRGKVDLYRWDRVDGVWRWRLVSTK